MYQTIRARPSLERRHFPHRIRVFHLTGRLASDRWTRILAAREATLRPGHLWQGGDHLAVLLFVERAGVSVPARSLGAPRIVEVGRHTDLDLLANKGLLRNVAPAGGRVLRSSNNPTSLSTLASDSSQPVSFEEASAHGQRPPRPRKTEIAADAPHSGGTARRDPIRKHLRHLGIGTLLP